MCEENGVNLLATQGEENLSNLTENQRAILLHAAEISECVLERSIGPDLEEWNVRAKKPSPIAKTKLVINQQLRMPKPAKSPILQAKEAYTILDPDCLNTSNGTICCVARSKCIDAPARIPPNCTCLQAPDESFEDAFSTLNISDLDVGNISVKLTEFEKELQCVTRQYDTDYAERQVALIKGKEEVEQDYAAQLQSRIEAQRRESERLEKIAHEEAMADTAQLKSELLRVRQETQQSKRQVTLQSIVCAQNEFASRYNAMVKILQTSSSPEATESVQKRLRELVGELDKILKTVATNNFGPPELLAIENLCQTLRQVEPTLQEAIEQHAAQAAALEQEQQQQLAAEQRKQQLAAEQRKQQEAQQASSQKQQQELQAQQQQVVAAPAPVPATVEITKEAQPERLAWYKQIQSLYAQKLEAVKPLQNDEQCKKYRNLCQRAINMPLNAISAADASHLRDKFDKLYGFMIGQPFRTSDAQITINDHPLARDYCLLLMAKKFVSQGETTVSSNPQAAYAFATVIVSLWQLLPDFGHCLLAYVFKESPYLVPYFIKPAPGQPTEDYCKLLGYRFTDGKQLEQPDMYLKRQAGIARLYAAIMITPGRQANQQPHPYGIKEAWRWLSSTIELEPLPDICATIISEILPIIGPSLWRSYGIQFTKLLFYMKKYYFPRLNAIDEGGPKTRLELLLNNVLSSGRMEDVAGTIRLGFW